MVAELAEQAPREDARCPACGGEPMPDATTHRLSALGYAHDDQGFVCADCGHEWTSGVPIGEFDRPDLAADLECDSCGDRMLVHRVRMRGSAGSDITLDLKCQNSQCHYFEQVGRDLDENGVALVGHPEITGQTEGADPYGWKKFWEEGDEEESEQSIEDFGTGYIPREVRQSISDTQAVSDGGGSG